ncbi:MULTISPECIES: ABC transporter ATP-binding protein [Metabacillus]|uniref:ABC transporter ATP-binding protein n=2 Tax=Metabacillus TaxID=2675233 RepID=A0A179SK72_9BACI|nr:MULTISPECIES: ATP-binding cassette domain-containing protein [Metabacillus]OAS82107.1 ABC transporter ATP-binding protein [Metabacillus litoralis]QNF29773.1 ATP-binding cassette domain-containing protein [Metabacillus sp. KUDC1714]
MFIIEDLIYKDILFIDRMEIPSNKITCLVGESGAGKSTLLKMLNIMLSPDEGEIYFKDKNLKVVDPILHRRKVVMLAQQPTIFEGTIRDNLNIGLNFSEKKLKEDDELNKALEIVHLNKGLNEDAYTLSGGEKQRLALARVYLMEPEVYLLDEPTAALDEDTESVVMDSFITQVKLKGQSVIMITHSQKIATKYGEKIITLEKRAGERG